MRYENVSLVCSDIGNKRENAQIPKIKKKVFKKKKKRKTEQQSKWEEKGTWQKQARTGL